MSRMATAVEAELRRQAFRRQTYIELRRRLGEAHDLGAPS
jgi:hypothetical protein